MDVFVPLSVYMDLLPIYERIRVNINTKSFMNKRSVQGAFPKFQTGMCI